MADQYAALGVDSSKASVKAAFKGAIRSDFPGAFVNIVRSLLFPGYVMTQHADGDGSKFILRLLMYFLTGKTFWLYGAIDDAWSMNFGDVAAGGFVDGELIVTDTLALNAFNVPKEKILEAVSERVLELLCLYQGAGINVVHFLGGETADLPRQVQTIVFDMTVYACMCEAGVIKGNARSGDRIWGFGSDGQAAWEKGPNSAIMSNGLTMGVAKLISPDYVAQFPNLLLAGATFEGRYYVNDRPNILGGMTVAEALLSPTRQWAILIKILVDKLKAAKVFHLLHGISMNTGGGATKISNVGTGGIRYFKVMPFPPPIFRLIQAESGEEWCNMFRSFNCGVGLDIIGDSELAPYLKAVEQETEVRLYDLGLCQEGDPGKNSVALETPYGTFSY